MNNCPVCSQKVKERIKERRLCTKYVDDKNNYIVSCYSCFVTRNEIYKEMWKEYQQSSVGY